MALRDIAGALRDEEFWRDIGRNTRGIGELGIEFGEGAVGEIGSGLTGLVKLATGSSFEEAGEAMENVQDWAGSWYEPKYQETEDYMQSIGGAVQPLITEIDRSATWLEDKTGIPRELSKFSLQALAEVGPFGLIPKRFTPNLTANALRTYDPNLGVKAYHGTDADLSGDNWFDNTHTGKITGAKSGHWFASDPDTAAGYALHTSEMNLGGADVRDLIEEADKLVKLGQKTGDKHWFEEAARKMEEAERLDAKIRFEEAAGQTIYPVEIDESNLLKVDAEGQTYGGFGSNEIDDLIREAEEGGYKGLQIDNLSDEARGYGIDNPVTHYNVFDPDDIKSSIGFDSKKNIKPTSESSPKVWGSPFEIQKELDNVRTDLTNDGILSPEMVNENVDSIQKIMLNWDDYVQKYKNVKDKGKPSNDGGRIISADDAKELDPTGKYPKNRALSQDVHEVGSWFVKRLYEEKLAKPPGTGGFDQTVMFTAGGTGSGKTTALKNIPEVNKKYRKAEIVYDTNLSNFNSARKKIDQALDTGRDVQIVYVYRGLEDSLENGAIARAAERMLQEGGGRTVPTIEHAKTHVGARNTVEQLQEHYKNVDGVKISVIDNSHGKGGAIKSDLSKIEKFGDDISIEKARLDQTAKEMHEAGKIHDIVRNAAKKAKPPKKLSETDVENMVNQLLTGFL